MALTLSPVGGVAAQFFSNDGVPLSGGLIYTYLAGTTTPTATYTSASGTIAHSNPIVLDSGGRVPSGETWLTDGTSYKFVLKDSADVLIATYDNIVGINSNFANFFAQEEIQTATADQTVFTLSNPYVPGANTLSVFVDGVNQYNGSTYSYVETSASTVTFYSGLHVGALVKFTTVQSLTSGQQTDAALVTYVPAGTGAVTTTVQAKLRQTISIFDFIPVALQAAITARTSTTNVTSYIQAAVDYASSIGGANISFPAGKFNVNATINWASYVNMYGIYGETPNSGVTANAGTVFNWTGSLSATTIMFSCINMRDSTLEGFAIEGNGAVGLTGILYDSTDGSAAECTFTKFSIRECYIGVQWGTTGLDAANAAQGQFITFTIWSGVANSIGFVVNSGNVGQQCLIEHGGIQTQLIGIDLIVCNLLQIRRCFGGGVMDTGFIRAAAAIDVTIQGCSSECWGTGRTWRTNRASFLEVVTSTYPMSESTITLIGNQINNPINVGYSCRITSVSDAWGYCKDYTTGVDEPAKGNFTAGLTSCLALNNGVNEGSISLVTGEPTMGWIDSAYVALTNMDPIRPWVAPAFDAVNFSANGSMVWTVDNPDLVTLSYKLLERTMTIDFSIANSTISGTLNNTLQIKIPNGKTSSKFMSAMCRIVNSVYFTGYCYVAGSADTFVYIQKNDLTNFTAGTNNVQVQGQLTFEIS